MAQPQIPSSASSNIGQQVLGTANQSAVPAGYILVSNGTNAADWTSQGSQTSNITTTAGGTATQTGDLSTLAYEIFEPGV